MLHRVIVSALVTTPDNKVLFGMKNPQRGGVYPDTWHIPGGGIEAHESPREALIREVKEEVGIDISQADIELIDEVGSATTPKKLSTGEVVACQMQFLVFRVRLSQPSTEVTAKPGDDLHILEWAEIGKVNTYTLSPPSVSLFLRLGWLTPKQALAQHQFTNADQELVAFSDQPISWRISAYALVFKDDKLLLIKNRLEKLHDIIGGGIEFGETIEDGLHREAMEEGGVRIKIGASVGSVVDWFYYKKGTYHQTLQLFYTAQLVGELGTATDPDIEWAGFVPLDEIGTTYHLPRAVENVLRNCEYIKH